MVLNLETLDKQQMDLLKSLFPSKVRSLPNDEPDSIIISKSNEDWVALRSAAMGCTFFFGVLTVILVIFFLLSPQIIRLCKHLTKMCAGCRPGNHCCALCPAANTGSNEDNRTISMKHLSSRSQTKSKSSSVGSSPDSSQSVQRGNVISKNDAVIHLDCDELLSGSERTTSPDSSNASPTPQMACNSADLERNIAGQDCDKNASTNYIDKFREFKDNCAISDYKDWFAKTFGKQDGYGKIPCSDQSENFMSRGVEVCKLPNTGLDTDDSEIKLKEKPSDRINSLKNIFGSVQNKMTEIEEIEREPLVSSSQERNQIYCKNEELSEKLNLYHKKVYCKVESDRIPLVKKQNSKPLKQYMFNPYEIMNDRKPIITKL